MSVSEVEIYNRALQMLGAARVNSPTQNTRNAKACNAAYSMLRDALLREYRWTFAIRRASLAALAATPTHGPGYAYQLPTDFLRLLAPDDESTPGIDDRMIEGQTLVTDSAGPIDIIYIARIEDTTLFSPSFTKALAADLAFEICQELTNSGTRKESLREDRKQAIRDAKRTHAIERRPQHARTDSWIRARGDGYYEDPDERGYGG